MRQDALKTFTRDLRPALEHCGALYGGKRHDRPCHHNLDEYLPAYVEGAQLAGDGKGWLFRTAVGRTGQLSERPLSQADVYRMIRRRAEEAGIRTKIG